MKKSFLKNLLPVFLILGITGCGIIEKNNNATKLNPDYNESEKQEEKIKPITTSISTNTSTIDIKDGKIILPEFQKNITNQETNEITKELIETKDLKFLNSKNEELKVENNFITVPNEDDTITIIYKENDKEFKTTIKIKALKLYITFGSSTLYYGKYKAEGDLPSNFNGVITINSDKTATYVGSKFNDNGKATKVNLTGTWEVKAKSIAGLQGPPDNPSKVDGIFFTWSDGSKDAYGISKKYFGNQFMGYRWISE